MEESSSRGSAPLSGSAPIERNSNVPTPSDGFTLPQIELLQQQIKEYKVLSRRFNEYLHAEEANRPASQATSVPPATSSLPSLIPSSSSSTPSYAPLPSIPMQRSSISSSLPVPTSGSAIPPNATLSAAATPPVPAAPAPLSYYGSTCTLLTPPVSVPIAPVAASGARQGAAANLTDSAIGVRAKDFGPLIPTACDPPLVMTLPYASTFRESLHIKQQKQQSLSCDSHTLLLRFQHQLRAQQLAKLPVYSAVVTPTLSQCEAALYEHTALHKPIKRTRKQSKRDVKIFEKDFKKQRNETAESLRRRNMHFVRAVMHYRDDFFRYHRYVRNEQAKTARAVRAQLENNESKKEKEDLRAESKRLQALKENNMVAYVKLVEETKNERLKYLLRQTDNYILQINSMIAEQASSGSGGGVYYGGKNVETVVQPHMLRGGDLKEYQLSGLQWMVSLYNNNLNGILADEMGLGKTIQTIALLCYIMEYKQNNGPFLIVVPLSTLSNWINETHKWAPDMVTVVYRGTPATRKQIFKDEIENRQFNILFTTYEYIMKDKGLLRKVVWQYIIVDEGHRMKNVQSKFAQTLGSLYQSKHRILLTGTPLQNNLPELWALLNFLLPSIFKSVETFDQWFNKPFSAFKSSGNSSGGDDELAQLNQEERLLIIHRLHEVLRPFMLRRIKDQVLDQLPDKVEKVLRCDLSGWQKLLYKVIHEKAVLKEDGSWDKSGGVNNAIMQLRKVCNHPYLFFNEYTIDEDLIRCSGKFELLNRMLPKLQAGGHRLLIFSQMTQVMTILERFLEYKGFRFLRLDGSTPADERERRMFMFNDPDSPYFVFLLSTRAGGLGLNLATADTVILFDSDWNPMMDMQAQDRAHRIGQRNEVRVFRLITTSLMEERILARATDKRNMTEIVVEAGKFNRTVPNNDRKELMEELLREYRDGVDFDDAGDENAVPDDEQINELMAINEEEFAMYQAMDEARRAATGEDSSAVSNLMMPHEVPAWIKRPSVWISKYRNLYSMCEAYESMHQGDVKRGDEESVDDNMSECTSLTSMSISHASPFDTSLGPAIGSKRKRKDVVYDDGLTEKQFVHMLESGKGLSPSPDSEYGVGRHSSVVIDAVLSKRIISMVTDLMNITSFGATKFGLFVAPPDKSLYPDYYTIIPHIVTLKSIQQAVRQRKASTVGEVVELMNTLVDNARIYNGAGNFVHELSLELQSEFLSRLTGILDSYTPSATDATPPPKTKKARKSTGGKKKTSSVSLETASVTSAASSTASASPAKSRLTVKLPSALFNKNKESSKDDDLMIKFERSDLMPKRKR